MKATPRRINHEYPPSGAVGPSSGYEVTISSRRSRSTSDIFLCAQRVNLCEKRRLKQQENPLNDSATLPRFQTVSSLKYTVRII